MSSVNPFVLLHDKDNVLVCRQDCDAGTTVSIDSLHVALTESIKVGHKIARVRLERGATVTKHGAPIGQATVQVEQGEHVHLKNLRSNYTRSHSRMSVS